MKKFGFNREAMLQDLRKQEEEKNSGGARKDDPTILNYYGLDFGEEMTIRFLPADADGTKPYLSYSLHGPNMKGQDVDQNDPLRKVKNMRCAWDEKVPCEACGKSWEFHNAGRKDEAKMWRSKEYFVAQCIVIDSPIEIPDTEDGNPVKVFYLPWAIKEKLFDAIRDGIVEDPMDRDFIIRKTKNQGNRACYDKSYFVGKDSPLPDWVEAAIDEGVIEPRVLEDLIPDLPTTEETQEWVEVAEGLEAQAMGSVSGKVSDDNDGDQEEEEEEKVPSFKKKAESTSTPKKKTSSSDLVAKLKAKRR